MSFKWTRRIYLAILFIMGLTGFAQMPIFKRYYIADIPGLGWLADFFVTHYIHYLGAAFLLGFSFFLMTDFFTTWRKQYDLTKSAYIRLIFLIGLLITGIFRVLKNLPDVLFSPNFTMFIDISHLGFMMLLMGSGIVFMVLKTGWLAPKSA